MKDYQLVGLVESMELEVWEILLELLSYYSNFLNILLKEIAFNPNMFFSYKCIISQQIQRPVSRPSLKQKKAAPSTKGCLFFIHKNQSAQITER